MSQNPQAKVHLFATSVGFVGVPQYASLRCSVLNGLNEIHLQCFFSPVEITNLNSVSFLQTQNLQVALQLLLMCAFGQYSLILIGVLKEFPVIQEQSLTLPLSSTKLKSGLSRQVIVG